MRKAITTLLLLTLLILPLVANTSAEAEVTFDLSEKGIFHTEFGFTRNPEGVRTYTSPESISQYSFAGDGSVDEGLYVYWIVKGSRRYNLKLYADGPLKLSDDTLLYSISWGDGVVISAGGYGVEGAKIVHQRSDISGTVDAGYVRLALQAFPEWNQRAGSYTGLLSLAIESLT